MKKILLVEDDEILGMVLNDQLEMNGYEVNLLKLPGKTVENLLENKFDLVIMDKLLNGTDGTKICAEIKDTEAISNVPVLMMSGFDGAKEVCIAAGANNFIAKPFEIAGLLKSIETTINSVEDFRS